MNEIYEKKAKKDAKIIHANLNKLWSSHDFLEHKLFQVT